MKWTDDIKMKTVMESLEVSNTIKCNNYLGKNACTAWVNFDGTTTPPTIRDSFNVRDVVRTGTGIFKLYTKNRSNANISISWSGSVEVNALRIVSITEDYIEVKCGYVSSTSSASITGANPSILSITIFGGKTNGID